MVEQLIHWKSLQLQNKWLSLVVVPELGGRMLQLKLADFGFFFVHPGLLDQPVDATRLGKGGSWLNFGGEKIWPAPQGWETDDQWPGPPDPVLDSGVYVVEKDALNQNWLKLKSPIDQFTGLQIEKEILLSEQAGMCQVKGTFLNTAKDPKSWSVWPVIQMNTAGEEHGRYKVYCPVNQNSSFNNGYKVMHGLVNNPQISVNPTDCMVLTYDYLVGKVGMDTAAGWTAYVDTKEGKVLALIFPTEPEAAYPEGTNIQLWTAGRGYVYSRGVVRLHQEDRITNPPYLELELLSPIQEIQPGASISYTYQMAACTIPEGEGVAHVSSNIVHAEKLKIKENGGQMIAVGQYGVFADGQLSLVCVTNSEDKNFLISKIVNPLEGVSISFLLPGSLVENENWLELRLYDLENKLVEIVDRIKIK